MTAEWDEEQTQEVSARERLRSGAVETPPPDNRRTRRAAVLLFVPAFLGAPMAAIVFLDSDPVTRRIVGLILLAYVLVLGYLMVKSIARR
ncbi:hypothetical protein [Tsukamurella paurometabola]|uniref:Uncharacterized protein n=1 Tax=Tsukamurella paurometabola TaxID=2061 RepID=A0A3P8K571_TSUPA|nr:hypothetical protein [Tsukamurella paurometabola]MBS4100928.1 hypothetical protein [Tsukamurella paurometabola]UEA83370.1 hypothetical protein LK411_00485 [Tsukamurella paurometabola]VDR40479.1 Uncharacterised protein [Tsukamurella paurometabola]